MTTDPGEHARRLAEAGRWQDLGALARRLPPVDAAAALRELDPARRAAVLAALPPKAAARIVEELPYPDQAAVLTQLDPAAGRRILGQMSSDDVADLLGEVGEAARRRILVLLPAEEAAEVRGLLGYPPQTAGGLMTPEFVSVGPRQTVEEAMEAIRRHSAGAETVYYLYVTDGAGRLAGVVSLRQLVLAEPGSRVEGIMSPTVVSVPAEMDQEELARTFGRYDFLALPVVDGQGRLLGVVTFDDILDVLAEEATEDITVIGGSQPLDQPYGETPIGNLVRKRVGWLLVLFLAQSVTGTILAHFEEALSAAIALAFFIPLLIDTGGNAGSQAATLVTRAMALGEVGFGDFLRVVAREVGVGFILGAVMAAAAFGRAYLLGGTPALGYTVALAILGIVVVSTSVGATLPLLARRLNLDPAVAASPIITTVADAAGLILYFQIARLFLGLG